MFQSLLRLSLSMFFAAPNEKSSQKLAFPLNEVGKGWHVIWNCLMRSLPKFCNLTSIIGIHVDAAAFMLLCNIMLSDTKDSYLFPLLIWDLRLFKRTLSTFALCFSSCYFSRRTSLGDLQYLLDLRQNVLPAVLAILNLKEFTTLNERFVVLLPATAFALSIGSTPLLYDASGLLPLLYATELVEELAKIEESPSDFLECSVEVLAKIDIDSGPKPVNFSNYCQNVRLPLNLRDQLFHEMENHVLECIKEVEIDKMLLSEVIYTCALLANFMFCSYSTSFLVSELVACCIPCGSNKKLSVTTSSRAVLLLQKLTIGADSSMVEYIKELVAFPDFDIFNEIRDLHQKIRQTYSPRVHLLNFVKRPHYVPPRLLLCRSTQKVLIWSLCGDLFLIYKES
ncbi:serine/threonine-protein kinase ATM-like isoform X6 [Primulina eburnea]|uniref:serine/threonine-protein kinase ATM-like isoform X6 n=1 Tax=Primulina eburnea TaxID=1245227 RepID=UPI003C6C8191